jgi:type II secretory pathway component PulJ
MLNRQQRGATLVELMIGSTLGLLLLSAAAGFYAQHVSGSSRGLQLAHLQGQLRAVLTILHRDLRRSGYYGVSPAAAGLDALTANPFTDADDPDKPAAERNDVRTGHYATLHPPHSEAEDSCILYSYDLDADGALTPSGAGMERFGFRLRHGLVQMRFGGEAFDCSAGSWTAVTDAGIEITRLQFTLHSTALHPQLGADACVAGDPCLYVRAVEIHLAGRLRAAPDIAMQLEDQVRLRNDRYIAALPGP